MATLLDMLRELPARVFDELHTMVETLGPQATPDEMVDAVLRLSPETREAVLALLVTHLREELANLMVSQDDGLPAPDDGTAGHPGAASAASALE